MLKHLPVLNGGVQKKMSKLNTVLVYDEGDTTFSKHAEQAMIGYPTASSLFTTSRSSGVGAVVITHQPHLVLSSLRSEAYTKIIFNLSDAEDARYMGQACSLSREEQEMISKLPNYHAIISTRRIQRPFIIKAFNKADEIRKKPVILKPEARQKVKELQKQVIPREQAAYNTESTPKAELKAVKEAPSFYFDKDAGMLLENIHEHPFLTTVERYKMLNLSASKGNKALNTLIMKGLVSKESAKTRKGRGGAASLTDIKKEGLKALGKTSKKYTGKGGLKHAYYEKRIAEYYEKNGCEAKQEHLDCDVAVKTPEGLIAVEVCIHTTNIQDNIDRNLKNGFNKTILVFELKEAMKKTGIQPSKNVELKLIDDYLE